MKKVLSLLLALALALSCAVCAFAAKDFAPPEKPNRGPKFPSHVASQAAAPGTQSLTFALPTVTDIAAVWNGEVLFDYYWMELYYGPANVAITVTFDDGTSEVLTSWYGEGYGASWWWWEVWYEYDEATGKVLFFYIDSNLYKEYRDSLGAEDEGNWPDLLATLPQTVITVPADLRENHLNSLPKTELKLGENQRVPAQQYTVCTFTPAKDGLYYFYSADYRNCDPWAILADANFNWIDSSDDLFDLDFGIIAELQAGKTYYLIVGGYWEYTEEADKFDVGVRDDVRKLTRLQLVMELFTGGIFRQRYISLWDDGIYSIPGNGTWIDTAKENLEFMWANILFRIIDFIFDIMWR